MFRVLLPIDTKETVARRIGDAVSAFPGDRDEFELVVLHVYGDIEVTDAEGPQVTNEEVYDMEQAPESVEAVVDQLEAEGFPVSVELRVGKPREVILSVADDLDVDHIIMGGRRRSRVGKVLFGSITQGVLLNSEVPVTAVMTEE